ncbi:Methylated-DNA--protein-cysteine methyltransferase [Campylobacter majalis]|uniref:Methylated-DNA--protein-cysteine methyltransferase n=1 Tax=Campylobacter majalis TaxID=2790656 RepID=A0ABN7K5E6_9BACT|nr:methylated-DNA--[protein]-cysteine S-methyltransferase [Campylobacter majalis]CAD7287748.1 Methylated-DNA--protein-cysteine methyltransferase [Campylobacter majalis]
MKYINTYESILGTITLTSDGENLTALLFETQLDLQDSIDSCEYKNLAIFDETKSWLDIYFSKKIANFTPRLKPNGTNFRKNVWQILTSIPYGMTKTYKEIAHIIAMQKGIKKMSAQAVGGAVKHNPISIIIPCHRVIGSNAELIGYAGGLDIKEKLLQLEKNTTKQNKSIFC